ncbi:Holliday junction branch migration protein RuvA [Chloroflexota bacterium]
MISSLEGRLEALGTDWAMINVGGIGFQVYLPVSSLSSLGNLHTEVKVHTHLHLREDNVTLYGFNTTEELELFETLISVSGLGPRLALAMLSSMNVEQLTMAISTANAELLTVIPGIGKKVANRIILELKDKIGAAWMTTAVPEFARENADLLSALTSLGYSAAEAMKAISTIPANDNLTLEEKIKSALQYFGSA